MQSQTGTATDASGRGRRRADRDSLGSRRLAHVPHPFHRHDAENANGRLRRWLPRHLDIDRTSDREIQEIVLTTNLTPRKCPGHSSSPLPAPPRRRTGMRMSCSIK